MDMGKLGEYAFLAGVLIAAVAGVVGNAVPTDAVTLLLVVLGIAVGVLNITEKETTPFLVAAVALVIAGTAKFDAISMFGIGTILKSVVTNISVFVAPGAVLVALKAIWALASSK